MGGLNFDVVYQQYTEPNLLIDKKAVPHRTCQRSNANPTKSRVFGASGGFPDKFAAVNVAKGVMRGKIKSSKIGIFTPSEVKTLLSSLMAPRIFLGSFA